MIAAVAAFVAASTAADCAPYVTGEYDTGAPPPPLAPAYTEKARAARAYAHKVVDRYEDEFAHQVRLSAVT